MSFQDFVKKNDKKAELKKALTLSSEMIGTKKTNKLGAMSVLLDYPKYSGHGPLHRLKNLFPFSLFFKRKILFERLGQDTLLVREINFSEAFKTAEKKLTVKNGYAIRWRGVYKESVFDDQIISQKVGYKFFVVEQDFDDKEYLPVTEQDRAPVEIDDFVITDEQHDEIRIKLLSFLNKDRLIVSHMIRHVAEKKGIFNLSEEIINRVIDSQNTWVTIGRKESVSEAWRIILRIVEQNCICFMQIMPGKKGSSPPSFKDVMTRLIERNINFGIKEDLIKKYLESNNYRHEIMVAKGITPIEGQPSRIEEISYNKALEKSKKANKGKPHYAISPFVTVKKDEMVLKIYPGTKGQNGKDIFGRVITASGDFTNDEKVTIGKNLRFENNDTEVYARIGGNLFKNKSGVWNVEKVLTVQEVSKETGNLTHVGSVFVEDSVHDGFSLIATGNVHVEKSVGSSVIEAGGDINILLGMNGKGTGTLISHFGSVNAKYLFDAKVQAEKNVMVDELISNCQINAGSRVFARGLRSSIWGGDVRAYLEINATNIGSIAERATVVGVGIPQEIRLKLLKFKTKSLKLRNKYKKLIQEKADEEDKGGVDAKQNLSKINIEVRQLRNELSEVDEKIKELKAEEAGQDTPAKIVVVQTLHGGVKMYCNSSEFVNKRFRKAVVVRTNPLSPELIKLEPYIYLHD